MILSVLLLNIREQLIDRKHWLTLEQIFVEKRVYKDIENKKTSEAVRKAVWDGMKKHKRLFVRPMVEEDVARLLEVRIRRISAYDIERNRKEIEEIEKKMDDGVRKRRSGNDRGFCIASRSAIPSSWTMIWQRPRITRCGRRTFAKR